MGSKDPQPPVLQAVEDLLDPDERLTSGHRHPDAAAEADSPEADDRPVTLAQLRMLDEGEILEGYLDGVHGVAPGADRSCSYRYGWRNGMIDRGAIPLDGSDRRLRREFETLRRAGRGVG